MRCRNGKTLDAPDVEMAYTELVWRRNESVRDWISKGIGGLLVVISGILAGYATTLLTRSVMGPGLWVMFAAIVLAVVGIVFQVVPIGKRR